MLSRFYCHACFAIPSAKCEANQSGVGHSAPYEDKGCYDLTVSYLFLSGSAKRPLPPLQIDTFTARDVKSDFELPWIMRALVDSPEVRDLFPGELQGLREGVLAWKPTTKALKEIKKRVRTNFASFSVTVDTSPVSRCTAVWGVGPESS